MSLYDGLGISDSRDDGKDKKPDVSGWSSGFKLLHSQVQAKKKALQSGGPKQKRGTTLAPVIDLKRRDDPAEVHFNLQTGRIERIGGGSLPAVGTPFIASEPPTVTTLLGVSDEYDPLRPNDYESFVKRRKEQRQREREEERRKERENRHRVRRNSSSDEEEQEVESEFERRKRQRAEEEEEDDYERPVRTGGAAIAPPPSLIEDSNSPGPASSQSSEGDSNENNDLSPPRMMLGQPTYGMSSVASKIMAKYGYKKGQGLGKKEQGMSTALFVEKTSKRGGKIIHERDIPKTMPPPEPPRPVQTTADLLKNPSKVILLRNMVGPGEVDEELEPETAEECTKYGKVTKCVIFEMPGSQEDEAVRIFVEFERIESATKAIVDLNGRYFGGRVVKACFYNLDKFRRLDLGDEVF